MHPVVVEALHTGLLKFSDVEQSECNSMTKKLQLTFLVV